MRTVVILAALFCSCSAFVPATSDAGPGVFVLVHPGASRVQVVADWNLWGGSEGPTDRFDPFLDTMTKDEDGKWTAPVPADLPRGRYRYAFLVDGHRLLPDPTCPERSFWNGQEVSVLVVR